MTLRLVGPLLQCCHQMLRFLLQDWAYFLLNAITCFYFHAIKNHQTFTAHCQSFPLNFLNKMDSFLVDCHSLLQHFELHFLEVIQLFRIVECDPLQVSQDQ